MRRRTAKTVALGVSFGFVGVVLALAHASYVRLPTGIEPKSYVTLGRRAADSGMFRELSAEDYRNLQGLTPSMEWSYFRRWPSRETLIRPRDGARTEISARFASANYLDLLGVKPLIGSVAADPVRSGGVAVIGEDLWRRFFGSDPDVLGSLLILEGEAAGSASAIVGVVAREFAGAVPGDRVDAWKLDASGAAVLQGTGHVYMLGVPSRAGPADFAALASLLAPFRFKTPAGRFDPPTTVDDRVELVSGIELLPDQRRDARSRLAWLAWLVALLLVLAFTTLVEFLLAEHRRSRDAQAIRIALGAAPWDVFRKDLATYSLWIGATAVVAVAAFGYVADALLAVEPFSWHIGELHPASVLAGLAASTGALAVLFAGSLAKVSLEVSRGFAVPSANVQRRAEASGRRLLMFVAAANLVLVFSVAGRHWADARRALPFEHDDVLMLQILDPRPGAAQAALAANPQVSSASTTEMMPLLAETVDVRNRMRVLGRAGLEDVTAYRNRVGAAFFSTLGLDVVAGHPFDGVSSGEAVLSRAAATRFFGDDPTEALGESLELAPDPGGDPQERTSLTVVGVIEDLPYQASLEEARYVVYSPGPDLPNEERWLVRHAGSEPDLVEWLQGRIGGDVFRVGTIREIFRGQFLARRSVEAMLAVAAAFAALLAVAGVAGSLAKSIAGSARSIGIRLAVGATVGDVTLLYAGRVAPDLVAAGAGLCAVVVAAKWASPALGPIIDLRSLPVALVALAATTMLAVFLLIRHFPQTRSVGELVEGGWTA